MSDVHAVARLLDAFPGAEVVEWPDGDLGVAALRYAAAGWAVFPLRGKVPAIAKADGGNGVHDATTDLERIAAWWERMPTANIGGRVPAGVVVLDVDPRHGGLDSLARIEERTGPLVTRTAVSGRGDGGRHLYFRHPGGTPTVSRLRAKVGDRLDLKTSAGYTVLPPSRHPDTGVPYRWLDPAAPIVAMPDGLRRLLAPAPPAPPRRPTTGTGDPDLGRRRLDGLCQWIAAYPRGTGTWNRRACYGGGILGAELVAEHGLDPHHVASRLGQAAAANGASRSDLASIASGMRQGGVTL